MPPSTSLKKLGLLAFLLIAPILKGESKIDPRSVVVIYNSELSESKELAQYYSKRRAIPTANLVGLKLPVAGKITRSQYRNLIEKPLISIFSKNQWWARKSNQQTTDTIPSKITTLVCVYGVPFGAKRDDNQPPPPTATQRRTHSVAIDSELSLLGIKLLSPDRGAYKQSVANPYFGQDKPFSSLKIPGYFMVGRIDGPSVKVCKRMIDDAIAIEKVGLKGFAYLDLAKKGGGYAIGDRWIKSIEKRTWSMGIPTVIDSNKATLPANYPMDHAAIYFGWYTGKMNGPLLDPAFRFKRGAIAVHLHSFSATNLRNQKQNWVGPLLAKGAAASLGNVYEPYLTGSHYFDIFFDRLAKGYTLVEAAHMSIARLSWRSTVIGDPLYQPFKATTAKNPKTNCQYTALATAIKDWQKAPKPPTSTKTPNKTDPIFLEVEGLYLSYIHQYQKAEKQFYAALSLVSRPRDKTRLYCHLIQLNIRQNNKKQAQNLLLAAQAWIKSSNQSLSLTNYEKQVNNMQK